MSQHAVGALLADSDQRLRLGVQFHLDDAEAGAADELWSYVGRIVASSREIRVRRFKP